MSHHSNFDEIALVNGAPRASGTVQPQGGVDWMHVWIIQPQGSTFAAATGDWSGAPASAWTVDTIKQPGSAEFTEGPAFALAFASMSTRQPDGTTETTIQLWSETLSCV